MVGCNNKKEETLYGWFSMVGQCIGDGHLNLKRIQEEILIMAI